MSPLHFHQIRTYGERTANTLSGSTLHSETNKQSFPEDGYTRVVRVQKHCKLVAWKLAGKQLHVGNGILTKDKKLNQAVAVTIPLPRPQIKAVG